MTAKAKLVLLTLFISIVLQLVLSQNLMAKSKGEALFKLCTQCHGMQGEGAYKLKAPAIAGMEKWYIVRQLKNFKNGVRGMHTKDIAGLRMRPMAKTLRYKGDVDKVATYVSSLPKTKNIKHMITAGNPEAGQGSYAMCMACHGVNGEGNKAMNAPALANLSDWYIKQQLQNFKHQVRAANPAKDPIGATMAPMAMTLADDAAIDNVISYIKTLKK